MILHLEMIGVYDITHTRFIQMCVCIFGISIKVFEQKNNWTNYL